MGRLEDRVAIVTGGGRGIGRGIVLELAREGASVVVADIDEASAERTASEARALGRSARAAYVDVTDPRSAEEAVVRALDDHGGVDILVNNAGVAPANLGEAVTAEDFDRCYEVNLKGIWVMTRALVPHFRQRHAGKVVNIASIAGRRGGVTLMPYAASKAGAISLTQSFAEMLGPHNVNVNAICPGLLWTDMWRQLEGMMMDAPDAEAVEQRRRFDAFIASRCPLRREQTPEDVGKAAAFLASEDARNITGQSLNVDGGIEMH